MKRKDLSELRNKTIKDLKKLVSDKKEKLTETLVKSGSAEKNNKVAKALRKEIAQVLTFIREKEIFEKMNTKAE